jgi:hypothetical protein
VKLRGVEIRRREVWASVSRRLTDRLSRRNVSAAPKLNDPLALVHDSGVALMQVVFRLLS